MYEAVSLSLPGFSAPPLRETLTVGYTPNPKLRNPYTPNPKLRNHYTRNPKLRHPYTPNPKP